MAKDVKEGATKLDPKKYYEIKGSKASKHLETDKVYVQPGLQASKLIDANHATLVGEFDAKKDAEEKAEAKREAAVKAVEARTTKAK